MNDNERLRILIAATEQQLQQALRANAEMHVELHRLTVENAQLKARKPRQKPARKTAK